MQVPEPPVLQQPDREHGERQEEAVDQQAEAVEPVQLRLLLVDAQLGREQVLLGGGGGGVRGGGGGGGHDDVDWLLGTV